MAIGITFLESHAPKPLNSIILFDRNGEKRLHYSKVHTCDFDEEKVLSSGADFYVADLNAGKWVSYDRKHLTKLKRREKFSYWNQIPSHAIQDITERVSRAYKLFFENLKRSLWSLGDCNI